ncbi:putative tripeptidyl-peptidase [Halenospora varia]|nr:putative tripeptidyl-peptidase [Halenospora varia]
MALSLLFLSAPLFPVIPVLATATSNLPKRDDWNAVGVPPDSHPIILRVHLHAEDLTGQDHLLTSISDPGHSNYGQFLDQEEICKLVKPSNVAIENMVSWVTEAGVKDGDIKIDGNLAELNTTPQTRDHNRYWEQNQLGFERVSCNFNITPSCLICLYNINYVADPKTGGKATGQIFTPILINGAQDNQTYEGDASEGNLDGQYFMAITYPMPVEEYIIAGRGDVFGPLIPDLDEPELPGKNEPYMELLDYLLSIPPDYARTVCNKFRLFGARGVSMIVSSGDSGIVENCQTNDGQNKTRFNAMFPYTCPYVTSVGGTIHVYPEHAVMYSSGGFSDLFSRPKWQDKKVPEYLHQLDDRWEGLFNPAGRGFPDVSAQSAEFTTFDRGIEKHVPGTSAAAPTFAGIIALINSARVSSGMMLLGFLNPWLYNEGFKALTDVNRGGSKGCTGIDEYSNLTTPIVLTGLGTPDFAKLFQLVGPDQ